MCCVSVRSLKKGTEKIIDIFYNCLHGKMTESDAEIKLQQYIASGECDGYWHGSAGMDNTSMVIERGCI